MPDEIKSNVVVGPETKVVEVTIGSDYLTLFSLEAAAGMVGQRPMFNGSSDWIVTAARVYEAGFLVALTLEHQPLGPPASLLTIEERLDAPEAGQIKLNARVDATKNVVKREVIEYIVRKARQFGGERF